MRFSVFTASTPDWSPTETAAVLAAQGWHGVEWRVTDQEDAATPGFWAGNRATWPLTGLESRLPEIAKVTREAGLEFSAIGGYAQSSDHPTVERLIAATAKLGAERLRVTMPALGTAHYRDLFTATRAHLEWAVGRAAEHGVRILVELHHRTIVASASAAIRLVDGLDPTHIGVIHDLGNLIIEGHEDHLAAFQMLGPYLAHVHIKNAAWRQGATCWHSEWTPLREGQADIEAYLRALHTHGYDDWITVEDFSTAVPLESRLRDNLAYLTALHHRTSMTTLGSRAASSVD
jgi:sugar phosphate isomerase/epimerase